MTKPVNPIKTCPFCGRVGAHQDEMRGTMRCSWCFKVWKEAKDVTGATVYLPACGFCGSTVPGGWCH